jgi:hypothetical protein
MEYRVTIAIPTADESHSETIYEALARHRPEAGPVMDIDREQARTSFVLGLEAEDPLAASAAAVEMFREASVLAATGDAEPTKVIDLHAELAQDDELPRSELQTA